MLLELCYQLRSLTVISYQLSVISCQFRRTLDNFSLLTVHRFNAPHVHLSHAPPLPHECMLRLGWQKPGLEWHW